MKISQNYIIPFKGLKEGLHQFEFRIDDTYFGEIEYSDISEGELEVGIDMIKRSTMLELDINIKGYVLQNCDICLDLYKQEIDYSGKLFVKFGPETLEESDDLIVLSEAEHELNLIHYIYESINLSLPFKRIHPVDFNGNSTCNPEMIKKLKEHLIINEKQEHTDPRWDKLKDLISNN